MLHSIRVHLGYDAMLMPEALILLSSPILLPTVVPRWYIYHRNPTKLALLAFYQSLTDWETRMFRGRNPAKRLSVTPNRTPVDGELEVDYLIDQQFGKQTRYSRWIENISFAVSLGLCSGLPIILYLREYAALYRRSDGLTFELVFFAVVFAVGVALHLKELTFGSDIPKGPYRRR